MKNKGDGALRADNFACPCMLSAETSSRNIGRFKFVTYCNIHRRKISMVCKFF
jgi:hypothetical protein